MKAKQVTTFVVYRRAGNNHRATPWVGPARRLFEEAVKRSVET